MAEKQEFFKLEPAAQNKLRSFMAILSITHGLQFLTTSYATILTPMVGIGVNLILLYFSIFITRAPKLYFQLITWSFWFVIIFDGGVSILLTLWNQEPFGIENVLSLLSVALAVVFAKSVMRYRHSVSEAKKSKNSGTAQ